MAAPYQRAGKRAVKKWRLLENTGAQAPGEAGGGHFVAIHQQAIADAGVRQQVHRPRRLAPRASGAVAGCRCAGSGPARRGPAPTPRAAIAASVTTRPACRDQHFEQPPLGGREMDHLAVARAPAARRGRCARGLQRSVGIAGEGGLRRVAQRDAHPRMQLRHAEGLGQVVVRARVEGLDLLPLLRARRQHDDRAAASSRAVARIDVDTVAIGQPEVDQEHVDRPIAGERFALAGGGGFVDRVAFGLQRGRQQAADRFLVFHHEDTWSGALVPASGWPRRAMGRRRPPAAR